MNKENEVISKRLLAVASFVKEGQTLYDVGSDHAYLPSYLLKTGKIPRAFVSDIALGPLSKAKKTLNESGQISRAEIIQSDGLKSRALIPPCCVSIAGMGGELICKIIDEKPSLKDKRVRLILQPMTRPEILRKYLTDNGFEISKETTVLDGKPFSVLVCSYSGKKTQLSDGELLMGAEGVREENPAFFALAQKKLGQLVSVTEGKKLGKQDTEKEEKLIEYLKNLTGVAKYDNQ